VPWGILAEREPTDAAVQDALLALPYAYSKLSVHGRAAVLYGRAVDSFGKELTKVDASIASIEKGEFLKDLVREEIRQDKDWVIRLRGLPEAPETFYLMALMASHDFQTALQNYLDLEDMRKKLVAWQGSLDAFDDLIRVRRAYYEPLLPEIDKQFRKLDAQMRLRLEQRKSLDRRLPAHADRPPARLSRHRGRAERQGVDRARRGSARERERCGAGRAAPADRAPERRSDLERADELPPAPHRHPRPPARAERGRRAARRAVRRVRAHAPGRDA
jgi:hypothetical protein